MKALSGLLLAVVAVIHLLPLVGVLGEGRLEDLYGIPLDDPNLVLLMRHRAVLFGLLGGFVLLAAFRPVLRPAALVAGAVSVVSFLVLALSLDDANDAIARVITADWIALACLAGATLIEVLARRKRGVSARDGRHDADARP